MSAAEFPVMLAVLAGLLLGAVLLQADMTTGARAAATLAAAALIISACKAVRDREHR
jgi:hypothetical protein